MFYSLFLRTSLVLLGAFAYFFSDSFPLLLWLAPFPLLLLAIKDRCVLNLLFVFLTYFTGNFFQVFDLYSSTPFPIQTIILPIAIESFFFSMTLWFVSRCVQQLQVWYAIFVFPTLWVSFLYLSILRSNGNITHLSIFSQLSYLSLVQIVSITGLLGLSFLTLLFPSALAISWSYRKPHPRQALLSLLSTLLIFAAILTFGVIRLQCSEFFPTLRVGLAAKDSFDSHSEDPIAKAHEFAAIVHRLAKRGAEYILQPEKTLRVTPKDQKEIFQILSHVARENKVYVLAPLALINRTPERNALYVFAPDGTVLAQYDKMHPVPGLEKNFAPGKKLATILLPTGLIGLAICHDMDFLQPTKAYSQLGAGLLFVPARDFGPQADGKWHAQVAILQSISGGFSLARAAQFGFLSASDSKGRILAWEPTLPGKDVSVVVDIPFGSGHTFYAQTGDWFPWLNCLIAILFLGLGIRKIKK